MVWRTLFDLEYHCNRVLYHVDLCCNERHNAEMLEFDYYYFFLFGSSTVFISNVISLTATLKSFVHKNSFIFCTFFTRFACINEVSDIQWKMVYFALLI